MKNPWSYIFAGVAAAALMTISASAGEGPATNKTDTAASTNKITLKVIKVDSEETAGEDGHGTNAVDGKAATIWHTQWQDENPPCPHEIIIEMIPPSTIKGITYLPRQDEEVNGTIKGYEIYISDDDKKFGDPVKKGSFTEGESKAKRTITFDAKKGKYLKLRAVSEINDNAWTSAAEIGVVPND